MPRATVEPMCNLTLSRAEWSELIGLLERNGSPRAIEASRAIRKALHEDADAARVGIDRECQKWIGVRQMANTGMSKLLSERMREQIQAAERTVDW